MEGRYPNGVVAAKVAAVVGEKAKHIRDRGFDGRYYRDLILELITKHQPVTREDINQLLLDKLPEVLSEEQKLTKIHNLMSSLSRTKIQNIGSRGDPQWIIIQPDKQ